MAAEVSSSRQTMKNNNNNNNDGNSGLITRDFLGVSSDHNHIDSKELDLDLHVPFGWEKRLDLQSGKVYIQRSNNPTTKTAQNQRTLLTNQHHIPSKLQDHLTTYPTLNLFEQQQQQQPSLDLKLVSNTSTSLSPSTYTSVCTLDKVKSALHRAERSSPSPSTSSSRKRWMSSPSPSNNSSSPEDEVEKMSSSSSTGKAGGSSLLVAAACPGCFLFVLVSKNDPKCPKCSSIVNLPVMTMSTKKAKIIDLNISI